MSESTPPTAESTPPVAVRDRAPRPAGLFPRHLQTWFVAGVAGLIVLVVLLTGQQPPARTPAAAQKAPATATVDPNQVRIQEYRDRIDEQVRRLQAEQADLALSKQALTSATREPAVASASAATAGADDASGSVQATLQQDQAQRAYRSLYADNLAWTTGQKEAGPAWKLDGRDAGRPAEPPVPAASSAFAPALTSALAAALAASKGQPPPPAEAGCADPGRAARHPPPAPREGRAIALGRPRPSRRATMAAHVPAARGHHHRGRPDQSPGWVIGRARQRDGDDAGLRPGLPARPDSAPAAACSAPPRRSPSSASSVSPSRSIG